MPVPVSRGQRNGDHDSFRGKSHIRMRQHREGERRARRRSIRTPTAKAPAESAESAPARRRRGDVFVGKHVVYLRHVAGDGDRDFRRRGQVILDDEGIVVIPEQGHLRWSAVEADGFGRAERGADGAEDGRR